MIPKNFHSRLENMPWTQPTSSHFWPDRPTSRGHFHNVSLNLASLTSYQPMVEFLGHSNHFHISNQLMFLIRSTNFRRWFSQTKFWSNLSNLLPTYGTFSGHSNYLLCTSSHEHHVCTYPLSSTSPWGVPKTSWTQGGPWSDTRDLWRRRWEGPSDPTVGEGPRH